MRGLKKETTVCNSNFVRFENVPNKKYTNQSARRSPVPQKAYSGVCPDRSYPADQGKQTRSY